MLSFLTLTGVVATDLGLGDTGFVGDPVLLLASSTLLAAEEGAQGFVDFEDNDFAGDPLLLFASSWGRRFCGFQGH